jgi:YfiH family protein
VPAAEQTLPGTDWLVPSWPAASRVRGFVTTRHGGVSAGAYASLNLGFSAADEAAHVVQNRGRVEQHLPAAPCWLRQVHGARVVALDERPAEAPMADAAVTRRRGLPLVVLIADCLPVLLADRAGTVVGVAHAGWRGVAAGVLEATVAAMQCPAPEVVAWIGPGIGPEAFEVGRDVLDAFAAHDARAAQAFRPLRAGKWLANLPALARMRLRAAGVTEVSGGTWCTARDASRFYSYRRDGPSGRMGAFVWLDPADR